MDGMNLPVEQLVRLVRDILLTLEVRSVDAEIVADNLVEAELLGYGTHGVVRLPRYVREIQQGQINLSAEIRLARDLPASVLIDGDWGFGQVIANMAVDLLVERARQQGVASAGVFHANDVARLGAYTTRIAEHGMLGLMTVNDGGGSPHVAPWGGIAPLFSTNPLSFAAPRDGRPPVCVDMSTSICAASRILLALKEDAPVPPGLILDAAGRPSINPGDLFASPPGSLLPVGAPGAGHKGFALSLIVDILSGALTGAGCSGADARETQGLYFHVIHLDAFVGRDVFTRRLEELLQRVQENPRADGVEEIRIPGERAMLKRSERQQRGVTLMPAVWEEIQMVAKTLGVTI